VFLDHGFRSLSSRSPTNFECRRRSTCWVQVLPSGFPGAAVLLKKTCGGRVRSATRGARGGARDSPSRRGRARPRCAAIPSCRKVRSVRTKTCGTASGARKIAPRSFRSATAGLRRNRRDSPIPTGAWNAGCSHYDKPGSLSGRFRSQLSPQSIGDGPAISKSLYPNIPILPAAE
jgi:hypothetical protein